MSAVGETFTNFVIVGVLPQPPAWATTLAAATQIALPIAFAYAILRHRVLDLGFAINRTVVYAAITAALVIAVGAVDWVSGKLLSNTHVSAVFEAAATIALGAALGWLNRRIERAVDRVLFRSRYVAKTRVDGRIAALEYATTSESIDEALVGEAAHIFALESAAVFRRTDGASLARTASRGWEAATKRISLDHLLIRSLRAEERTLDLASEAISSDDFPAARAQAKIAIPIVVRHDFLGVALYGQRLEDRSLDPEDVAQLERLVAAATAAYDAVDAAEWRRRALASQHRFDPSARPSTR